MYCRYHAKLPVRERNQAHRAFQCDDACVMVASLAFGMGIDKPNIRRIIHYVSACVSGRTWQLQQQSWWRGVNDMRGM
jgi:superfamily II DNA helicase RecQ